MQSFTLHRIVFHGNQSLLKLRDFEINYLLFFLEFYFTNLSLVDTSLVFPNISFQYHIVTVWFSNLDWFYDLATTGFYVNEMSGGIDSLY